MSGKIDSILARLARPTASAAELLPVYRATEYAPSWQKGPSLYRAFARKLIDQGHPARAFELAREGLAAHPNDWELRYLQALALTRGGNIAGAELCAAPLLDATGIEPALRAEVLALIRSFEKGRAGRTIDPAQKREHAARASVVVFTGHLIDHPQRESRDGLPHRFPADPKLIRNVSAAIRAELDKLNVTLGVCSVACGSDILFAEHILARGSELHVLLPYELNDFYATSVDFDLPGTEWKQWRNRARAILERATEVHYATPERYLGDTILLEFTGAFMLGLAILRAAQRGVVPVALGVCDPSFPKLPGGTADVLELWARKGLPSNTIDLRHLREQIPAAPPAPQLPQPQSVPAPAERVGREVRAMLFAEGADIAPATVPQAPQVFLQLLDTARDIIRALPNPPVAFSTWGNGLFVAFERPGDCAEAALRLLDGNRHTRQERPPLRIGLHSGPVFCGTDPNTGRPAYFGGQVTRAAQIAPVTTPGCAFASEQFAAVLAIEPDNEYACEYVGTELLAQNSDRCAIYRLARGARGS